MAARVRRQISGVKLFPLLANWSFSSSFLPSPKWRKTVKVIACQRAAAFKNYSQTIWFGGSGVAGEKSNFSLVEYVDISRSGERTTLLAKTLFKSELRPFPPFFPIFRDFKHAMLLPFFSIPNYFQLKTSSGIRARRAIFGFQKCTEILPIELDRW